MFVPEFKPAISVEGIVVDNVSPDNKVLFIEEGHDYFHVDDIVDGKLVDKEDSEYNFRSPTGILSAFKEHFDSVGISERYVVKHQLDITAEELRAQWSEKARIASDRGSKLHAYCESIYDGWDFGEVPQEPQARHAEKALEAIKGIGWKLAKTELLVYNTRLRLAGQVDLLLSRKHKGKTQLGIFDYKFLKEEIQKKSFYNPRTRQYKWMTGPFKHLMDCNFYHYSIQMELYRMLMGKYGDRVVNKMLVVMTEDDYNFVEGHPMTIWVDGDGDLQAKYKKLNGNEYDSSQDSVYNEHPYKVL